jgi:hemolysin activation/secretion protein
VNVKFVTPLLIVVVVAGGLAHAQTYPDAGALRQQIERDQVTPQQRTPVPRPAQEVAPLDGPQGATVVVRAFEFSGNTLIPSEQLAPIVARYVGRPVTISELHQAAADIANAYREAGWIVRTILPRQDITHGVVTIHVVEAIFGGAIIEENPAGLRLEQSRILSIIEANQKRGEPLNAEAIDRALMLASDLPGVIVSGTLREGKADQETDLALRLVDGPLVAGELGADNAGSRSTGEDRATLYAALNSPLGMGDQFTSYLIHTEGNDYVRLGGTFPVGSDGWRVGLNASQLSYRLITQEFVGLNAEGVSGSSGVEASYPLIRSRMRNLYFQFGYDDKNFTNRSGGAITTQYKVGALALGLNANLFDALGGGGATMASLTWTGGKVDLSGSPNEQSDAATTRTAGAFSKLRYSLSRQQVVSDELSAYFSLSGQLASKNLDSSEKFYLGGSSGVRAFPVNEGGGSEGTLATIELRQQLPKGFSLTAFYDAGSVRINRSADYAGAPVLNRYSLSGYGLALTWRALNGSSVKLSWAHRAHENPNLTATGNDQDGSHTVGRLWLQVSLPF